MRAPIVVAFLSLCFAGGGLAQSSEWQRSIKEGNDARQSGDHKAADGKFREAVERAEKGEEPKSADYRARFYLGLNAQQAGDKAARAGNANEAVRLFEEAEKQYKKALELQPDSSSVLLNLGTVELRSDDVEDAIEWLQRGLALNDQRQPQFAALLGDAERRLAQKENDEDDRRRHLAKATTYYWQATTTAKDPPTAAHEKLMEQLLRAQDGAKLIEYARLQLDRDLTDFSLDATLNGLHGLKPDEALADELLEVFVAGLAKKGYDRSAFIASEPFRQMLELVKFDIQAARLNGLMALYHGASTAAPLEAWTAGPPEKTLATRRSLQQISRALAGAARRDEQIDHAERYYRVALALTPDFIDPETFFELGTLLYVHRRPALTQLLLEYEPALLAAIGSADPPRRFQFHRVLGSLDHLVMRLPEAKDHLERAVKMAAEDDSLPLDPALRIQLADVYGALNQPAESIAQRLLAAEAWAAREDLTGVRNAISKIDPTRIDTLSLPERERFQALVEKAVVFLGPVQPIDSVSVKRLLAFLAANPDPITQRPALESLRSHGVADVKLESANGTMLLMASKSEVKFFLP